VPAADGVDARARRVAARLLATRARRARARPGEPQDPMRTGVARHAVGGHPARAARVSRTVQALEREGWVALERAHRPGGGIVDHLLVGPAGVVVVDSRAWVGRIEVTRGVVQQNGFWRELECAEVARTAGAVAALLPPPYRTAVRALICVAQHDLAPHLVAPGVHVVGVTGLAGLLRSLPPRLQPAEVVQLHTQLRHALVDSAPPEQLTTAEFDRLARPVWDGGCVVDAGPPQALPIDRPQLFVPVVSRSLWSAARTAARRRRRARGGGIDWRLFGARLVLAALVALGVVVLGPELVPRSVQPVPSRQLTPSSSTGPGLVVPAPVVPASVVPASVVPASVVPAEQPGRLPR
jgi:hypothetical protein